MRTGPKILLGIGVLAAVVLVGVFLGWIAGGTKTSADKQREVPRPAADHTPFTYVAGATRTVSNVQPVAVTSAPPNPVTTNTATATNSTPTWEDIVDEILQADTDEPTQVKKLLVLYPHVPADGQVEIAQHLANLVTDEDYAPVREILTNAETLDDVSDVLLSDLLNRPNAIKLPVLLEIARNPQHPQAEESKDLLALYLDEDYGTAWTQWQQAMEEWLKENPD